VNRIEPNQLLREIFKSCGVGGSDINTCQADDTLNDAEEEAEEVVIVDNEEED